MISLIVGLAWGDTRRLFDFLASRKGLEGNPQIAPLWKMAPIYLLWCIWRQMNNRSFDDREWTMDELKAFSFNTLFLYATAIGFKGLSVHDFLV